MAQQGFEPREQVSRLHTLTTIGQSYYFPTRVIVLPISQLGKQRPTAYFLWLTQLIGSAE